MNPRVFGAFLLLFLLGLSPVSLFAEWYKDYESAQKMIKKGQWEDAIPRLRTALAEQRDEANNIKFYGMKFDDYFPHFYLGMAYFGLKDYRNALVEFEQSEKTGAIKQRPDLFKQLTDAKTITRAQLLAMEPPRPVETSVPKILPAPAEQVKPPETKIESEPSSTKVEDAVRAESPKTVTVPRPEPTANTPSKLEPVPAPVAVADPAAVKKKMQEGARKFFEGNYDAAIPILSSAIEANPKDASAPFLLGCAYAAKYLLTGSNDKSLYQKAETAFRKSRRINPDYKVANSSYISPAVLQIYERS